ncbi:MAG: hypothetical protein ABIS36_13940 [Chryseolinea sp.]
MKDARLINQSEIRLFYFGLKDVLNTDDEKVAHKEQTSACEILSNCEHMTISLCMSLPNGEKLEIESDVVAYADDFVILKSGISNSSVAHTRSRYLTSFK